MNPTSLFDPGRLRRWWLSRLPAAERWELGQRNVYILPTRAGWLFAATLLVMLVASINYQLSLGYALTFLLAGAALVSMHQTHANLRGLMLHLRPTSPVHAGEPARVEAVLDNPGAVRPALSLRFDDRRAWGHAPAWCDVPRQGQTTAVLSFTPLQRGWQPVPPLVLETVFPFGLFCAWTVWRPASRVRVWPAPEHPAPPLPVGQPRTGEGMPAQRGSGGEWDGVRPWRRGDGLRQVVWKKLAHSGEWVSRETSATAARELWLDWQDTVGLDTERRLSRLTAWVLRAERDGLDHGLRLPGRELTPAQGDAHRRSSLDLLAEYSA